MGAALPPAAVIPTVSNHGPTIVPEPTLRIVQLTVTRLPATR
jgi:hypothetical protein